MSIKLHTIEEGDFDLWVALRLELWPYHTRQSLLEEAKEIYATSSRGAFLAFYEGSIAGFIECSVRSEAPGCAADRIGYVEGWYVKPEFRGRDIGKTLLERAENWSKQQDCTEMASDTELMKFPLSLEAHTALGYSIVDDKLHFTKAL